MTNSQKLTIRASEIRSRLNEISGLEGDALTDEVRAEEGKLTTEYRDTECKLRAAIASDEPVIETRHADTNEGRELRALIGRADCAAIYSAAIEHRATDGATARASAALRAGAQSGAARHAWSIAPSPRRPATWGRTSSPSFPYVFPHGGRRRSWGSTRLTVGVGEAIFPGPDEGSWTVHTPAENADAE